MTGLIGHDQTGSLDMGSSFCVPCAVLRKAAQVKKEKNMCTDSAGSVSQVKRNVWFLRVNYSVTVAPTPLCSRLHAACSTMASLRSFYMFALPDCLIKELQTHMADSHNLTKGKLSCAAFCHEGIPLDS